MADYGYADIGKLADFANNTIGGLTANDIMRFPRANVPPVKHGRWKYYKNNGIINTYICTNCQGKVEMTIDVEPSEFKYCPNCGADMRGDTEPCHEYSEMKNRRAENG